MNIQIAINLISFLVGLLVGHWLAIGRDRRNEFNEIAEELHFTLLAEMRYSEGHSGAVYPSPNNEFIALRRRMSRYHYRGFDKAVEQYRQSKDDRNRTRDSLGQTMFKDTKPIVRAIEVLLRFTERR